MASAKNWIGALTAVTLGWVAFSTSEPPAVDDTATAAALEVPSASSADAVEPEARLTCDNGSTGDALALAAATRPASHPARAPDGPAMLRGCSDAVPAGCR